MGAESDSSILELITLIESKSTADKNVKNVAIMVWSLNQTWNLLFARDCCFIIIIPKHNFIINGIIKSNRLLKKNVLLLLAYCRNIYIYLLYEIKLPC